MKDDWVERTVDQLLAGLSEANKSEIDLDELGDAVGDAPVTTDQIDQLLSTLEERGIRIQENSSADLPALLRAILLAARQLKAAGKSPSRAEIQEATGLSSAALGLGLRYMDVLRS